MCLIMRESCSCNTFGPCMEICLMIEELCDTIAVSPLEHLLLLFMFVSHDRF
jgi:hypothetical protein